MEVYTPQCISLPPRHPQGSKFEHGQVLLICGSRGMVGSATLACNAALRTGCGMVHAAIAHSSLATLANKVTEPVLHSIDETDTGSPSPEASKQLIKLASSMQSILLGCGISHHHDTTILVHRLVRELNTPIVLDADGLNAFKNCPEKLNTHKGALIITPHEGEWRRLFGTLDPHPLKRITRLREIAYEYNIHIIYKGSPTIIARPTGYTAVMPVGNSGMATAGSGDVLAGITAALIAQGSSVDEATYTGVALHAHAGDYAAKKRTEYSLIATDIIEHISDAIADMLR